VKDETSAEPNLKATQSMEETRIAPLVVDTVDSLRHLIGKEIAGTTWFVITQERIQQFAHTTDDQNWIHVDPHRARQESPYGATIAHGFLTLSLLSKFMRQAVKIRSGVRMGINYGLNHVRFPAPVRAGNSIRARFTLLSLTGISGGFQAVFSAIVEVQDSAKPCCAAEWVVRYYV